MEKIGIDVVRQFMIGDDIIEIDRLTNCWIVTEEMNGFDGLMKNLCCQGREKNNSNRIADADIKPTLSYMPIIIVSLILIVVAINRSR